MKIQTLKNLKTQELNTNFQFTWTSEKNKKTQKNGKLWISQEIQFSFELRNLVGCFVGFFFSLAGFIPQHTCTSALLPKCCNVV